MHQLPQMPLHYFLALEELPSPKSLFLSQPSPISGIPEGDPLCPRGLWGRRAAKEPLGSRSLESWDEKQ